MPAGHQNAKRKTYNLKIGGGMILRPHAETCVILVFTQACTDAGGNFAMLWLLSGPLLGIVLVESARFRGVFMPRRVVAGVIFSAALAAAGPALGMEPKWPSGPYKYLVIDQDIKGVLAEFGRNTGLPVDVSDQVKGRLRGQVTAATATAREFLDNLCDSHGLVWYFDGAVLHVNAKAEIKTELVNLGRFSPEEANEKLTALGIADPRYPVRTTENATVISVSGPPKFVSMVRQALRPPPPAREDPHGDDVKVRVFRGGALSVRRDILVASRAQSRGERTPGG